MAKVAEATELDVVQASLKAFRFPGTANDTVEIAETFDRQAIQISLYDGSGMELGMVRVRKDAWDAMRSAFYSLECK